MANFLEDAFNTITGKTSQTQTSTTTKTEGGNTGMIVGVVLFILAVVGIVYFSTRKK